MPTVAYTKHSRHSAQRGVVLIIALIMLMVLSMISMFTIRQATSSTQVSNNTRTQTLAMQAAELALKTCDARVQNFLNGTAPSITPFTPAVGAAVQLWEPVAGQMPNWDGATSAVNFPAAPAAGFYTLVLGVNDTGAMYRRFPECMVEFKIGTNNGVVIITARGFGSEVSAVSQTRAAPVGTEVWLQSSLRLQ